MNYLISLFESIANTIAVFDSGRLLSLTADPLAEPEDPMQEYGTGTIVNLTGGIGWPEAGVQTFGARYSQAQDDFEYLSDGTITGEALTGGQIIHGSYYWGGNGTIV